MMLPRYEKEYSKMNKKNGHCARQVRIYMEKWRLKHGYSCWWVFLAMSMTLLGVLSALSLWLRPEMIGYQYYMVPWQPDCFVLQNDFKTGGNANRMVALYYAFHVASDRKFRYIAVPEIWQEWLCKVYSEETIRNFPVPVVPVGTGRGCSEVFYPIYKDGLRNPEKDVCEEWHLANFFRVPWYAKDQVYRDSWWKHFIPTGKNYEHQGRERDGHIRMKYPGKKIVTLHKRWLSVWCYKSVDPKSIPASDIVEKYCHMTPDLAKHIIINEAGLDLADVHVVVSSDNYLPKEDLLFEDGPENTQLFEFEPQELSFMTQVWMWTLSDVHIGHPNSTIDNMACRFKRFINPMTRCYPEELQEAALSL